VGVGGTGWALAAGLGGGVGSGACWHAASTNAAHTIAMERMAVSF
jgi:hypothetical protein